MLRHLNAFLLIVTLALAGCAGGKPSETMRTPSGAEISDRVPDFQPVTGSQGGKPMATTSISGRNNVTPYYSADGSTQIVSGTLPATDLAPVKIGVLVPLSGPQAGLGQAMLNAAQLALFDMNASNITIIPSDTTTGATRAANDVVEQGAQIILGPLFAQDVKAVSPIAKAKNIPVLAFSTDWTAASDNTYIMGFLPFGQVSRVIDYAAKNGVKNIGALIPETPYGVAVNSSLKNELQRQNLGAPNSTVFSPATGLPSAVQKISRANIDALLLPIGGNQLGQSATLLRENDLNLSRVRLIGTGLWDDSPQAALQLRGGWYAAPDPKLRAAFNRQYRDTYAQTAPRLATLAYDATALATTLAIKGQQENGQPAFSRADLTNPSGFSGLDGVFRFRPDGLAERGLAVLELRANGPVVIDPAPTHF